MSLIIEYVLPRAVTGIGCLPSITESLFIFALLDLLMLVRRKICLIEYNWSVDPGINKTSYSTFSKLERQETNVSCLLSLSAALFSKV